MDARDEKRIGRMAVHGAAGVLFAAVFIMAGGMQAPAVFAGAAGRDSEETFARGHLHATGKAWGSNGRMSVCR